MYKIPAADERAVAVAAAIRSGDVESLERMLREDPALATAQVEDDLGVLRTLLHIAADWPGHFPNGARTVAVLAAAGAEPNVGAFGPTPGSHTETPLHWAASCDDVEVLDALLDCGADIEAPGAVFTGGTAMSDAVIFTKWRAARRLLERGAKTTVWQAAGLGLLDRVRQRFSEDQPVPAEVRQSFWHACRGGHREVAEFLLDSGAELNWVGYDGMTPLDAAAGGGFPEFIQWLRDRGAKTAQELRA